MATQATQGDERSVGEAYALIRLWQSGQMSAYAVLTALGEISIHARVRRCIAEHPTTKTTTKQE